MRYFFASLILGLFLGCSTTAPSMHEYKLFVEPLSSAKESMAGCSKDSLKVLHAFGPTSTMSLKMHYTQAKISEYTYSESMWSESVVQMVTREYLQLLNGSKLFENVVNAKSRSKTTKLLEIRIDEFMQHFDSQMQNPHAKVAITLSLIDAKSSDVLFQKSFEADEVITQADALGGVESLNRAFGRVMSDSFGWFKSEVCR